MPLRHGLVDDGGRAGHIINAPAWPSSWDQDLVAANNQESLEKNEALPLETASTMLHKMCHIYAGHC